MRGWLRVVAAIVVGIVADGLDHDPPQHPVARGHLGRLRGHRHHVSMKSGYFTPQSQACMPPIELPITSRRCLTPSPSLDQAILRVDHVAIVVVRKCRLHAVGGFRGFAVADAVGNDDEVFRGVERLAGTEQFAGKGRRQHRWRPSRRSRAAPAPAGPSVRRPSYNAAAVPPWFRRCGI